MARLDDFAPTRCTALDRPAEAEGMQPEIERDEQADEREQRDRLAMPHQRGFGFGGECAMMLSTITLKSSDPGSRRNSSFLPLAKKVGVPSTSI